jgi:TPP-dependent pyruvate/acetoin dehydrogenase alpha subunit
MADRDPILVMSKELIEAGELTAEEWEKIKSDINEQVDQEYIAAESEWLTRSIKSSNTA